MPEENIQWLNKDLNVLAVYYRWKEIFCTYTKGINCRVSIETLNWYPRLTSWLVPINMSMGTDQRFDWYSIRTQSTLDQESVNSRLSANRPMCIDRKFLDCRPTVNQDVDGVLVLTVDQVWMEGIDRGYQSTLDCGCLLYMWTNKRAIFPGCIAWFAALENNRTLTVLLWCKLM